MENRHDRSGSPVQCGTNFEKSTRDAQLAGRSGRLYGAAMPRARFATSLLLAVCLAGASLPALAADPADAKTYKEAVKQENDGDVVGALARFESIPAARRDFLVRLHIASCKRKLGRFLASAQDLEAIVADAKADAATCETAQSDLDDLRARTPKVNVRLSPATQGVAVTLDGQAVTPPTGRPLDPGAHVVIATREGKEVFKRELQLAEATSIEVEIDAPAAAATPLVTPAPVVAATPTKGDAGAASGSSQRAVGWTLIGVGGVLGLGAAGAFWESGKAFDDWKASCGPTGCDDGKKSRVQGWDAAKWVGTGLAVVGVGIGVTLVVTAPSGGSGAKAGAIEVRGVAGAGMTGVVLGGRF
jgi:hypothetical protein